MTTTGGSSRGRLRTSFSKSEALDPFYSGGAVAVTSDAAWIAATFGTDVHMVEARTSRILHKIAGDGEDIQSLTLSNDDTYLVTASRSLALHFYVLPGMEHVRTISKAHEAPVALMAVDPTSSLLATGSADGSVKIWDMRGGYCTHVFRGHGGVISALCWHVESPSKAGRRVQLFTGCVDGKVRVWDLHGHKKAMHAKPSAVLNAHAGVVRGISLSSDGQTLVSGARDQTLVFWDARDGHWHRREIQLAHERIEALHSRLDAEEKEAIMARFAEGESQVLIATTVIEVGVDVPNATMMVIMDADRFGVSQLHQLRGRIGRGQYPGLCLLVTSAAPDTPARTRLDAVASTRDGFRLAELDLAQRHEGNVLGADQSGRSVLSMLRVLDHADVITATKDLATRWVSQDPDDPRLADMVRSTEEMATGDLMEQG